MVVYLLLWVRLTRMWVIVCGCKELCLYVIRMGHVSEGRKGRIECIYVVEECTNRGKGVCFGTHIYMGIYHYM